MSQIIDTIIANTPLVVASIFLMGAIYHLTTVVFKLVTIAVLKLMDYIMQLYDIMNYLIEGLEELCRLMRRLEQLEEDINRLMATHLTNTTIFDELVLQGEKRQISGYRAGGINEDTASQDGSGEESDSDSTSFDETYIYGQ
ncbi:hypothetical protein TWF506_003698 [Arthrobotrys conoides]|uniref:Uncharacterized protein n=1 Tax=Arthrobotrys conoides TaxID=74498 RepID=A0AAN8P5R1_9PEZI